MLRERGVAIKEITPTKESLGYSGVNGTMKTASGLTGEIQVNSPEMIYAKETPANARAILGDETCNNIAKPCRCRGPSRTCLVRAVSLPSSR